MVAAATDGRLSVPEYYAVLNSHLVPMFSGAELESSPLSCGRDDALVIVEGNSSLLIRADEQWPHCFRLTRPHPFDLDDVKLIKHFLRVFGAKLVAADQPFFDYLVESCAQETVEASVKGRVIDGSLVGSVVNTFRLWASQTYEGNRIAAAIGIDPSPEPSLISNIHFADLRDQGAARVISNGLDTLLVLSASGHIVEHRSLAVNFGHGPLPSPLAPQRYAALAKWAAGSRVALVLNRHGEIAVMRSEELQFAFRRGTWIHFSHAAMMERLTQGGRPKALMRAVYETCLDVSFSRRGGCIAIANAGKPSMSMVNRADRLNTPGNAKTSILGHLIGSRFDALPRPMREELLGIDGAVVLSGAGEVLAAGAIVSVPGGGEGGGRRAAAQALSRMGIAIKISADGGITAFTGRGARTPAVAFEL